MDLNWQPVSAEDDPSAAPEPSPVGEPNPGEAVAAPGTATAVSPPPASGPRRWRRLGNRATIAGALLIGSAAGAMLLGPAISAAQAATPTASASTTTPTGCAGHGLGGHNEAVSDASVVAKAIGISEADVTAALARGQTIAEVAKAHDVDPQKVIDALVADGQAELAAAVKAGTITQAQADAEQAHVTQRATDQVNGTFGMGGRGMGHGDHGMGGAGMDGSH